MLDKGDFIEALIDRFPDVKDEILDKGYSFSIGLQLGCFKRFTQTAIDKNNIEKIKECFDFVDSIIDEVTKDVENSIYISYLNHLNFSKNEKAKKYLSNKLLSKVEMLDSYNKREPKKNANEFLRGLE